MTAPTLPIHVDTQGVADLERLLAALKGIGPALAEVRSTNASLGNVASVTAQLQKLRAETKSSLGELKDLLSKGLTTTYKEAEKAAEKGGDDVVAIIQKENAKIQKALTEANTVAGGATTAGRRISNSSVERPMDMALVVRQQLRDASALNLDPATLLGLPSRDSMKSMGAQIAAQMREGIALENLRASSASGTDARSLLGLPSRDSMKSMGAQIAAQMREGIALENLRASSASGTDARSLLGLPSRDSMKSMGAQIAAQMREGIALENLRASSASGTDARSLLGLPSRDSMKSMGAQIAAQMREGIALENLRASSASGTDARSLLGLPSRDSMKSMGAQIAAQMREGIALENLRASSASGTDARSLLGLPSRDSMKSMGAQIAAQMREGIALENLRASSASGTDARSLLGLPSRDSMKSMGAQIAAQMREGIALENLRASSASGTDARSLLGLPSRDSMKSMGAQIAAQMREGVRNEALRAASASNIDVRTLLGLGAPGYSARASADVFAAAGMMEPLQKVKAGIKDVGEAASQHSPKLRMLTHDMNDVHSAARGLASGFGALWLTWGNLGPLLIGAAISNGFVQVIKQGAQVQNTFEAIRVLSEESASSVGSLNSQMLQLARTGPFGPLEIAEAMKTLSLAGLNAAEVGSAIKDVLNFSVAGNTTIKAAADVMSTVATAFGISAQSYNYVGDVIAKTAAISKSSVESIGESFKTASVINSQYGATLEDVGVGLALLSNLGIQGTAAGTSLRNMYVDLFGRSKKAEQALKELGVSAIDVVTGKARPLVAIFTDLNKALGDFTNVGKTKALAALFSERGDKSGQAILDAIRRKAKEDNVGVDTYLSEIKYKIDNAAGFMAQSAAQMALTPLNQMKSVAATLQATLVETFDYLQPYVFKVSQDLKAIFNSEEFRQGLARMVTGIAEITVWMVKHGEAVLTVIAAYAALKVALGLSALFRGLAAEVALADAALAAHVSTSVRAGSAMTSMAAAQGAAAATGMAVTGAVGTVLGLVARIVPWLTLAWGAWELYSYWSGKSAEKVDDRLTQSGALLASLRAERERLQDINQARREGITLEELQQNRKKKSVVGSGATAYEEYRAAKQEVARLEALAAAGAPGSSPSDQQKARQAALALPSARVKMTAKGDAATQAAGDAAAAVWERSMLSRESNLIKAAEEEARKKRLDVKPGDKEFEGRGAKGSGSLDMFDASQANKTFSNKLAALRAEVGAEAAILKAKHSADLMSEGTYLAQVLQLNEREAQEEKALIETRSKDYVAGIEKSMSQVARVHGEGSKEYMAEMSKQMSLLATNEEQRKKELAQLEAIIKKRRELAIIEGDGQIRKIQKEQIDYWAKDAIALQKNIELERARQQYAGYPPEYLAQHEAEVSTLARHNEHLGKLQRELADAEKATKDFWNAFDNRERSAETEETFKRLRRSAEALKAAVEEAGAKGAVSARTAGQQAADKIIQDRANKMRDDFADAVTTGIVDGGKAGGDALSKWLKDYFIRQPIQMAIRGFMSGGIDGLTAGLGASAWGGLTKLFGFANGAGFTSNSIVDTPTIFKFAKGVGVAGEAGPEAIMPLARDGQGRLGVRGGSGGGGNVIQLNYAPQVNVDARSDQGQVVQLVGMALKENNTKLLEHFEEMGYNV